MNQLEKNTYNKFLTVTRSSQNKPFSLRKDFSDFEHHKDYRYVIKLTSFFNKFPQINQQFYFEAPFKVYKDKEEYFDLKFYTSPRAIKVYSIYMQQLNDQDPDSEMQLNFIVESLRFIAKFCFENKIAVDEYIKYRPHSTFSWMQHLKTHRISIYTLYEFDDLQQVINNIPQDELHLLLGSYVDNIWKYKIRYYKSKKAKLLVSRGLEKIKTLLASK